MVAHPAPAPLLPGQRLTREKILRRWDGLPELKNAELVGGILYVASSAGNPHIRCDRLIPGRLMHYAAAPRGCEGGCNETWLLLESAPQPDAHLRLPRGRKLIGGSGKPVRDALVKPLIS
jgi:hypothetical protein